MVNTIKPYHCSRAQAQEVTPYCPDCLSVGHVKLGANAEFVTLSSGNCKGVHLRFAGHTRDVIELVSADRGEATGHLLSLAKDGNIRLWDACTAACLASYSSDATAMVRYKQGLRYPQFFRGPKDMHHSSSSFVPALVEKNHLIQLCSFEGFL